MSPMTGKHDKKTHEVCVQIGGKDIGRLTYSSRITEEMDKK